MRETIMSIGFLLTTVLLGCDNDRGSVTLSFRNASAVLPPMENYGNYGALWGDFNNDDRVDLIFMGHGAGPLFLAQKDHHIFEDVTKRSGIKISGWSYPQQRDRHGASCADFDNDGNLDLYISHGAMRGDTRGKKYDELLKGNGDFTFSDITHSSGTLNQFGRGRAGLWFDYDNDGFLDLYALNFLSNNVMYRNNGDATFTDVSDETGLGFPGSNAASADFDQDGDIDLLVTWPLKMLLNNGLGKFVEIDKAYFPYKDLFAYGIAVGDADSDGDLDIFVSRLENPDILLVNHNGKYRRRGDDNWMSNVGNMSTGVSWGDMDNDGLLDLVNIRADGYFVYQNIGHLVFSAVRLDAPSPAIVEAKNGDAAIADFDNDGLLDIATDDPNAYMLLQNMSRSPNKWIKLQFHGSKNNRLGIGNKVWVSSRGKLIAYREYNGSTGGLRSYGCDLLHIGVGEKAQVDIRVQWLNGDVSEIKGVGTNQLLKISDFESKLQFSQPAEATN